MRVEIVPDVFRAHGPEKTAIQALFRLLETFDMGRHDWVIDPFDVDDFAAFMPSHFPSLAGTYTSMARLASKREAAWTGTSQYNAVVVDAESLVDLATDLAQAAVVVVEDEFSDGDHFLATLIEVFGPERLRRAYREGWLKVQHSGGTGRMPHVAAKTARRFRRLIRVVAFLDSDRMTLESAGNSDKAAILREHCAHVHLLAWREAENYVPDRVLNRCGNGGLACERTRILNRLLPRQRAVYDMKKGFRKGIPATQREEFAAVADDELHILRDGFGSDVLANLFLLRFELRPADFEAVDHDAAADLRALLAAIDEFV